MDILFLSLVGLAIVAIVFATAGRAGAGRNEPPPKGSRPPRIEYMSEEERYNQWRGNLRTVFQQPTAEEYKKKFDSFEEQIQSLAKGHDSPNNARHAVLDLIAAGYAEKTAIELMELYYANYHKVVTIHEFVKEATIFRSQLASYQKQRMIADLIRG